MWFIFPQHADVGCQRNARAVSSPAGPRASNPFPGRGEYRSVLELLSPAVKSYVSIVGALSAAQRACSGVNAGPVSHCRKSSSKVQRCHRFTSRNDETLSALKFPERHLATFQ